MPRPSSLPGLLAGFTLALALALSIWRLLNWPILSAIITAKLAPFVPTMDVQANGLILVGGADIRRIIAAIIVLGAVGALALRPAELPGRRFWVACSPLILVILLAWASFAWSIAPAATRSRLWVFFAVSVAALVLGSVLTRRTILQILEFFAAGLTVLNVIVMFRYPVASVMVVRGVLSWTGLFDHKNFNGIIMAFAATVFLIQLFGFGRRGWFHRTLLLSLLGLSLFLLWKSDGVTGMVAFICVQLTWVLALLFLKWGHRLRKNHWLAVAGLAVLGAAFLWMSKDSVLAIFGRSSSLTGRVPLWSVLSGFIAQKALLGYGYGEVFWRAMRADVWASLARWRPSFAHNGFIEFALALGLVGLGLLLIIMLQTLILGLRYFLHSRTLESAWPLLFLVLIALVNAAESLLASREYFFWLLLVMTYGFVVRWATDPPEGRDSQTPMVVAGAAGAQGQSS